MSRESDNRQLEKLYTLIYEQRTQYNPDRIPRGAKPAYAGPGGKKLKIATTIAFRSHEAIPADKAEEFANRQGKERVAGRNVIAKTVKPIEEKYLRQWAEAQNLITPYKEFETNWIAQGKLGEAEHKVFFDEPSQKWIKVNNLGYHSSYLDYFYRLALHNTMFPEAYITFLGFVEDDGELQPLVSQVHVPSKRGATPQEVKKHMKKLGYENIPNTHDYINKVTGIRVEDLHDENVLIGPGNMLYVVDPVIFLDEDGKMDRLTANDPLEFE